MRPAILNPLFASVTSLGGIGPKTHLAYDRLIDRPDGARVVDLIFHTPTGIIDRRSMPGIAKAAEGATVTVDARVDRHKAPPPATRQPYKVFVQDDTGEMALIFFRAKGDYLAKTLPVGERRFISGRVEWFNGQPQMAHPDLILSPEDFARASPIEPVYPLTEGLTGRMLAKSITNALDHLPDLPEWQDPDWQQKRGWPTFMDAIRTLHRPETIDGPREAAALARLAYDELLANQLALALVRRDIRSAPKRPRVALPGRAPTSLLQGMAAEPDGRSLGERLLAALPFQLTHAQETAIAEIRADMASPDRMLRLLQGDVGSGKTVVALMVAATAIEAGGQVALMAPTELLARQHYRSLEPHAHAAGLEIAILTGREKGREREAVLAGLAAGRIDLVVGTHALFQTPVIFHDLTLAIIDEQHRFGVQQRLRLAAKGRDTDLLLMTATPIPRSLMMTYFGDVDSSRLTEKPAGRKPIETRTVSSERIGEVVERIAAAIETGAKVYWVCPLVDESLEVDLAAVTERFGDLSRFFASRSDLRSSTPLKTSRSDLRSSTPLVGLVHGKMRPDEKDAAMSDFQTGKTRVLVATTVIEVGVDVPDATIMVIEHAERFGLAQLHQLRGRVGRGDRPSTCLLMYKGPLGEVSKARLAIMRESEDGFRIAEEDLKLRGGGELLGTRQSGMPGFRLARLDIHADLMEVARDDARLMLARDPDLASARGEALKVLLYLFEREDGVRLLRAG
jgi:ATP-dependent DNA helicase RecG